MSQSQGHHSSRKGKRKLPFTPIDLPDPEAGPSTPRPTKAAKVAPIPDPLPAPDAKVAKIASLPDPLSAPDAKSIKVLPMDDVLPAPSVCPPSPAISHSGTVTPSLADPEQFALALSMLQDPFKKPEAKKIQLNAQGELTDAHGNKIELEPVATLKANLNRPKAPAKKMKLVKAPDLSTNPYFDAQLAATPVGSRKPRPLRFLEAGSIVRRAEKIRSIQKSQALYARRQEASRAFDNKEIEVNPNLVPVGKKSVPEGDQADDLLEPPTIEWWDDRMLAKDIADRQYVDISNDLSNVNKKLLNLLIDHPVPVLGPNRPVQVGPLPLMLTKAERKKIRTQGRIAREKEKQEQIKLGLIEPPKPKVKVNNLMRVLGTEATQDPTAMEKFVRAEMEARRSAHDARNQQRKLTPEERRKKTIAKMQRAAKNDPLVTVFKVGDLSSKQNKFKVSQNANQLMLTGCAVLTPSIHFIVVEGGGKPMRKYIHLLLDRIKWEEETLLDGNGQPLKDDHGTPIHNWCSMVWQGLVSQSLFVGFKIQHFDSDAKARTFLQDKGVVHYFDMAEKFVPSAGAKLDGASDDDL